VLLAEINLGEILWTMVVIFFMIIYFMILFSILTDLFRSHDLGGVAKTIWVLVILFLPLISMLVYLIIRGDGMAKRAIESQQQAQAQMTEYAQSVVDSSGGGDSASQIHKAKELLDSGAITQEEFDRLKAKALS
jgi:ABC-type multidrug transport system fused ATPase/permease subunit